MMEHQVPTDPLARRLWLFREARAEGKDFDGAFVSAAKVEAWITGSPPDAAAPIEAPRELRALPAPKSPPEEPAEVKPDRPRRRGRGPRFSDDDLLRAVARLGPTVKNRELEKALVCSNPTVCAGLRRLRQRGEIVVTGARGVRRVEVKGKPAPEAETGNAAAPPAKAPRPAPAPKPSAEAAPPNAKVPRKRQDSAPAKKSDQAPAPEAELSDFQVEVLQILIRRPGVHPHAIIDALGHGKPGPLVKCLMALRVKGFVAREGGRWRALRTANGKPIAPLPSEAEAAEQAAAHIARNGVTRDPAESDPLACAIRFFQGLGKEVLDKGEDGYWVDGLPCEPAWLIERARKLGAKLLEEGTAS